jgi:hypothetical protein
MKHEQFKTSTIQLSKATSAEKSASAASKAASAQIASTHKTAQTARQIEEETAKTVAAGRGR